MPTAEATIERTDADIVYHKWFYEGLKSVPLLTVSEWADQKFYLPQKGSKEKGKYRTERTPYIREILDNLSVNSDVQNTSVVKGTQLGFTMAGLVWFSYIVDVDPASILMLMPTQTNAKRHSKGKVAPVIEANPHIFKGRINDPRARDSGNEMFIKEYPGGELIITGANSAAGLRHFTVKYVIRDEKDAYPPDLEGEGDPSELAESRADTFGEDAKFYDISTPTNKSVSRIWADFEDSDQRRYYVPCPFCKKTQWLKWDNLKFTHENYQLKGKPTYQCEHCKKHIAEHYKTHMLEKGKWIPAKPGHPKRGYHLSSLYSPLGWLSWDKIVQEFLKAKRTNDPTLWKKFFMTRLAEPYDDSDQPDFKSEIFLARVEKYGPKVPLQGIVLTAGVDVQDDRLEVEVDAWSPHEENWVMEHKAIYGNSEKPLTWKELDDFLKAPWLHESGAELFISCALIDSGHKTDEVYKFVQPRQYRRFFATKGSQFPGKPIISQPSRRSKAKVKLFHIGTDTAKDSIFARLALDSKPQIDTETFKLLTNEPVEINPMFMHFNETCDEEYFKQLAAEKLDKKKISGRVRRVYTQIRERNEALDLKVLNLAALRLANPNWKNIIETIARQAHAQKTGIEMPQTPKRITGRRIISRGIE